MNRYVSKPQVIEAVQWTGTMKSYDELADFTEKVRAHDTEPRIDLLAGKDGAQGWVPVPVGHWVVRSPGDDSDVWPVDNDYFYAKYEAALEGED